MLPFSWFVVFRTLFCCVPHNSIYYTLSHPVCQHFFWYFLCFVSFYNASPIFLKTYVHLQHQSRIFCLEMGFFHQASLKKKSAEPHARRIIFFKNYFLSSCFLSFSCSCSISFISSSKEADAVFVCCAGFAAGFAFGTGFFSGSGATVSSVEAASSRSCEALS